MLLCERMQSDYRMAKESMSIQTQQQETAEV